MRIFKRIRDISMAAIHDVIDKAEDPVKMLNQYLRDMEDDMAEAEIAVAKQIAVEKKFQHQHEEVMEKVETRGEQAMKALESGNEDLARRALQDKKEQQAKAGELLAQYESAKSSADELRKQLAEMRSEIEKLRSKKDMLIARAGAARAKKQVNQALSGFGKDNGAKGFERMSQKVLQLEAEAEASQVLNDSNRSLDKELEALGGNDDVEEELAALKAQLASKQQG